MSSTPDRAMHALTDAGEVRRALDTRRVMHQRDEDRAVRASALYEQLRLLTTDELAARLVEVAGEMADHYGPRQVLIAELIEAELRRQDMSSIRQPWTIQVVVNTEAEPPELLGVLEPAWPDDEGVVRYYDTGPDEEQHLAPEDCVEVYAIGYPLSTERLAAEYLRLLDRAGEAMRALAASGVRPDLVDDLKACLRVMPS